MTRRDKRSIIFTAFLSVPLAVIFLLVGSDVRAADCPKQNDPVSPSIVCTGENYWCGGTCQAQPSCPGGAGDPYGVKPDRNCTLCVCACPADKPNDCTGTAAHTCQATNDTCAGLFRTSVCDPTLGALTQICGACITNYQDCSGTCKPKTDPSCPPPGIWDACNEKCVEKYILSMPTVAQSPQPIDAKTSGNMSIADGNLSVLSSQAGKGDIFFSTTKALRVDGAGKTEFNIGNWGVGATGIKLSLFGELCLDNGAACRSYWPLGLPESANSGDTLRYNGTTWVASSLLTNDDSNIGIGTTLPGKNLDIAGTAGGVITRLNDRSVAGDLWTGSVLARSAIEKWFIGINDTNDNLLFRRNGSTNDVVIDNTTGNVGIGTGGPQALLHVLKGSGAEIRVDTGVYTAFMAADTNGVHIGSRSNHMVRFKTNNIERMVILADGNVGVGTRTPEKNLDVAGTTGGVITRLNDRSAGGDLWTGAVWSRNGDEKWFVGIDDATDKLLFRRDGDGTPSNDMIIDTAGNVGVGTSSPAQKLDVNGTVQMAGFKMPTGAVNNYILTSDASGVGTWQVRPVGLPETALAGNTLRYNGTAWVASTLLHNNAARIGIGDTNPGYLLDIGGTATDLPMIRLYNKTAGNNWTGVRFDRQKDDEKWFIGLNGDVPGPADDKLRIRHSGSSDDVVIDTAGNVGIGTPSPAQKFDVNGTAQVTGFKMPTGAINNYVLTTDAAGVATWRQILFADACTGGKFDHLTAGSYDGSQGGYQTVNGYCGEGQHICTPDEILRSVYCTGAMPLPASGKAWVANGPPGFTSPAANDCVGWTSNAASSYGAFWQFTGASGGKGFATSCSLTLQFACCKQ